MQDALIKDPPDGPIGKYNYWTSTPIRGFSRKGKQWVDHGVGCNFSAKRQAIQSAGGFDEGFHFSAALHEELDFFLKAKKRGLKAYFNSDAGLKHLAAPRGGCREPDLNRYILGLCRSRMILVRRYSRFYQQPIATFRVLLLTLSYTRSHKKLSLIFHGLKGMLLGWKAGSESPKCTDWSKA